MTTAPMAIAKQIEDAAEYFAIAMRNAEAGTAVEIPEWLSFTAQAWIEKNAAAFTDMVVRAHVQQKESEDKGSRRPVFVLPETHLSLQTGAAAP